MSPPRDPRSMLKEAADQSRPKEPDWQGAARLARRMARARLAVAVAGAVLAGGVLLAGGLVARAGLTDEGSPSPAPVPGPAPPPRTETQPTTQGAANLVVQVVVSSERPGAATAVVKNVGDGAAGGFQLNLYGAVTPRRFELPGAGPGEEIRRDFECSRSFRAEVDSAKTVKESNEEDNEASSDCPGPVEPPPPPDTGTETTPPSD
jgi:hypothetical protein